MNIFNWLGKAGKMSVPAIAGLGGVAAVAGVASLVYLNGENPDNTSFNVGGNTSSNIVYSVGGNASYGSGAGAGGQEGETPVLISSRNLRILEDEAMRETNATEMAQSHRSAEQAFATSGGAALLGNSGYEGEQLAQFGGAGGGAAGGNGSGSGASGMDFSGLTSALSNMQNMVGGATGGAVGGAAGGPNGSPAAGGNQPSAESKGAFDTSNRPSWARGGGSGSGGVNNQFVTQTNGLGGSTVTRGGDVSGKIANALQSSEKASQNIVNSTLANSARFSKGGQFGNNLDSNGGRGSFDRNKALNRLRFAQKRSADEAKNKFRMANTTAFLGGERDTGGLTLVDGSVRTGEGSSSQDLSGEFNAGLGGLNNLQEEMDLEEDTREEDRSNLKSRLWTTIGVAVAAMIAIPCLMKAAQGAGIWAWIYYIAAAIVAVIALAVIVSLFIKAAQYANNWGSSGLTTACYVVGGILAAGVGLSFIYWKVVSNVMSKVLSKLGLSAALIGAGAAAGGITSIASSDAWKNERDN